MSIEPKPTIVHSSATDLSHFKGFYSYKTTGNIIYERRCARDLLIQLTLDSTFSALSSHFSEERLIEDAFFECLAMVHGRSCIVALCETSDGLVFASGNALGLAVSRSRILDQGWARVARMIWSRRLIQVDPGFQILVLDQLRNLTAPVALAHFKALAGSGPWMEWLLGMVAQGLLSIVPTPHLTPETQVSLGPCATVGKQEPAGLGTLLSVKTAKP